MDAVAETPDEARKLVPLVSADGRACRDAERWMADGKIDPSLRSFVALLKSERHRVTAFHQALYRAEERIDVPFLLNDQEKSHPVCQR